MSFLPARVVPVDGFENAKPDLVSALSAAENNLEKISETVVRYGIRDIYQACRALLSADRLRAFHIAAIAREAQSPLVMNLALRVADHHPYYGNNERAALRELQREMQGVKPQTDGRNVSFHRTRKK